MKYILLVVRIFVGLLFIFSGLVKANDPMGLSYKMQEFFEVWGTTQFNDYTLAFALIMNVFEIVAGVAVIIGWRMKIFSWLLLLLIIFFTFLTGYAKYSGKFASCGCFGDCIPITPTQSFIKDVVLLVLIIFLVINHKKIKPLFNTKVSVMVLVFSFLLSSVMQWWVLKYLPIVDCLPYKKGNHLLEQMKAPEGFIPDRFGYVFIYKKDGKIVEFTEDNLPEDLDETYEFVDRQEKLLQKGNGLKAKISDFSLTTLSGVTMTESLLATNQNKIFVFAYNFENKEEWLNAEFDTLCLAAAQKGIPVFIVTPVAEEARNLFKNKNVQILICDGTVVKTAARVKPTFFLLYGDLIAEKLSYKHMDKMIDVIKKYEGKIINELPKIITDSINEKKDSALLRKNKVLGDSLTLNQ